MHAQRNNDAYGTPRNSGLTHHFTAVLRTKIYLVLHFVKAKTHACKTEILTGTEKVFFMSRTRKGRVLKKSSVLKGQRKGSIDVFV